jgi:hypothetical protein
VWSLLARLRYRYDWKEDESRKNILRTHTTAVSTRMLYALAQEEVRPLVDVVVPSHVVFGLHVCCVLAPAGFFTSRSLLQMTGVHSQEVLLDRSRLPQ